MPPPEYDTKTKQRPYSVASPPSSSSAASRMVIPQIPPFQGSRQSRIQPKKASNLIGPYLLLQTIGEGEFAKVKLGMHIDTGEEAAIKLIKKENVDSPARLAKIQREIAVLKACTHPHIVKLYDYIETEKYLAIVLEYASGGELFDHILAHRYLKERDASKLFAQLMSGVSYMHSKNIVHRDLKLENLLLDRNRNLIITDFGFANQFGNGPNENLMMTSCGSPCYAAPELVVSEGAYVATAVDIWSCGVILYAMLAGYLPFDDDPTNPDGDNINQLYKYILSTPLTFPEYIGPDARDLLRRILVPDPTRRATMEHIKSHKWMSSVMPIFMQAMPKELEAPILVVPDVPQSAPAVPNKDQAVPSGASLAPPTNSAPKRHTIQVEYDTSEPMETDLIRPPIQLPKIAQVPSYVAEEDTVMKDATPVKASNAQKLSLSEFPAPPSGNVLITAPPKPMEERTGTKPLPLTPNLLGAPYMPANLLASPKNKARPVTVEYNAPSTVSARLNEDESMDHVTPLPNPQAVKPPHKNTMSKEEKTKREERRYTLGAIGRKTQEIFSNMNRTSTSTPAAKPEGKRRKAHSTFINVISPVAAASVDNVPSTHHAPDTEMDTTLAHTTASSSAAKRVMDWFRRKSAAKYMDNSSTVNVSSGGKLDASDVDARLREHVGAVDQNALTSRSPDDIMQEIRQVLQEMGCEMKKEGEFKVKCSRPKRKAAQAAEAGRKRASTTIATNGTSKESKRASVFQMLLRAPTASPGSSVSSRHQHQFSDTSASTSTTVDTLNRTFTPIYGDGGIDNGDEVRFSVEVCKMRNLKNLYIVDIRRVRGNIWGYKFLYHTLLERLDLKSKGYMNVE